MYLPAHEHTLLSIHKPPTIQSFTSINSLSPPAAKPLPGGLNGSVVF